MVFKIVVAGAGQLGSRYLQGLSKSLSQLDIYVFDVSENSLKLAEKRWQEVTGNDEKHTVRFITDLSMLPATLDVAIVSTTANVRCRVIRNILEKSSVKYWILEKVLAQRNEAIAEIESLIGNASKAWVNTPYRAMEWYTKIKNDMKFQKPFTCEIKAGKTFGLACNAIHYLDLLVWLSGESVATVNTDGLNKEWFTSKRAGFWDIFGDLTVGFSGGSTAVIKGEQWEPSNITIAITTEKESWVIHESAGFAVRDDGFRIDGRDEFQSEMTGPMIDTLLATGYCGLPTLAESAAQHKPLLEALLQHWNSHMPEKRIEIPIT